MFSLKLDQTGNTLVLGYAGAVTPDDARRCAEQIREKLAELQPGFRLVVDLTDLISMDISCSPLIATIMEMCNAAGVAEVLRIIPDPTRDIGLQILSFFHYGNDVYIRTFASAAEATEILAAEPA